MCEKNLLDNSPNVTNHTCPVSSSWFFRPDHEILDKAIEIMKFRRTNTISLIEFLKDKVFQQSQMLEKTRIELLQYKEIQNEIQRFKDENDRLKSQLQETRPPSTPDRPSRVSLSNITSPTKYRAKQSQHHDDHSKASCNIGFVNYVGDSDFLSQSRDMILPSNKSSSALFPESNYDQFPQPGTASNQRITWQQSCNMLKGYEQPQTPSNYSMPRPFQSTSGNLISPHRALMKRNGDALPGLNK
ncbi:272_t:CDS:2 [Funneliformis mosseae]|uniref:272_t:CDS:1 n=1 Tax=Funneliformis mosseae TaxID=27381 RepID=A0A9N9BLD8_FUNMO|nr:272_t:CDS:2 [Funneliformis mosseae]